jgi:hypothetical protein
MWSRQGEDFAPLNGGCQQGTEVDLNPCSPLPDPKLRGGDGTWPEAIPTRNNYPMPGTSDAPLSEPRNP